MISIHNFFLDKKRYFFLKSGRRAKNSLNAVRTRAELMLLQTCPRPPRDIEAPFHRPPFPTLSRGFPAHGSANLVLRRGERDTFLARSKMAAAAAEASSRPSGKDPPAPPPPTWWKRRRPWATTDEAAAAASAAAATSMRPIFLLLLLFFVLVLASMPTGGSYTCLVCYVAFWKTWYFFQHCKRCSVLSVPFFLFPFLFALNIFVPLFLKYDLLMWQPYLSEKKILKKNMHTM